MDVHRHPSVRKLPHERGHLQRDWRHRRGGCKGGRGAAFPPSRALARLSPRLSCGVASAGFAERVAARQARELMGEDIQLLQQETWVSLVHCAGLKKLRGGEGVVALSWEATATVGDNGLLLDGAVQREFGENGEVIYLEGRQLQNERVLELGVGGSVGLFSVVHICVVTHSGVLYVVGDNSCGQLGVGTYETIEFEDFKPVLGALAGKWVVGVSCGEAHTCCITREGWLYTFGFGRMGQLGHGPVTDEDASEDGDKVLPHRVLGALQDERVVQVAAGSHHTGSTSHIPT